MSRKEVLDRLLANLNYLQLSSGEMLTRDTLRMYLSMAYAAGYDRGRSMENAVGEILIEEKNEAPTDSL